MEGAQGFYRKTISHIYERDKERFAMCMDRKNECFTDFNSSMSIYRFSTITLKIPTHIFIKCDNILKQLIGQVKEE